MYKNLFLLPRDLTQCRTLIVSGFSVCNAVMAIGGIMQEAKWKSDVDIDVISKKFISIKRKKPFGSIL